VKNRPTMANTTHFTIGVLAQATDTKVNTIRFYEEIGLMPEPDRTSSGRRVYLEDDRKRLTFIRHCRSFGFSVEVVRQLLSMKAGDAGSCVAVADLAVEFRHEIDRKLVALQMIGQELDRMIGACPLGGLSDCAILSGLESDIAGAKLTKP